MRQVGATHRHKVIELLSERLAFERAAVNLYQAVLGRLAGRGGPYESVKAHLRHICEEEKEHQEWLEGQLSALGDDGTPVGVLRIQGELRRMEEAVSGELEPAQLFRALLDAEAADNAGWELLVELAERAQDEEARDAFQQRLHEEQEHFLFASHIAAVFASSEILDETVTTLEDASA